MDATLSNSAGVLMLRTQKPAQAPQLWTPAPHKTPGKYF